jgi:predicted GH43/DUF377 family glycosyl hydrolase
MLQSEKLTNPFGRQAAIPIPCLPTNCATQPPEVCIVLFGVRNTVFICNPIFPNAFEQNNFFNSVFRVYIGFRDVDHAQIGLARSRDGITGWQRHPANPIVRPGRNQWDADACYKPFAIFDGRQWLLWYNGRHGSLEQIGVALHDGEDLGFGRGEK